MSRNPITAIATSKSYQILEDGSLLLDDGTIIELSEGLTTTIAEAQTALDEEGIPRYSAADEMPPDEELSLAERIRRLARKSRETGWLP